MIEVIREALVERMRGILLQGLVIVVLGWRDSNHSTFTRRLASDGRIIFRWQIPAELGKDVGLVLLTRFIHHAGFNRIRTRSDTYPCVMSNGEIKRLLRSCEDLLRSPETEVGEPKSETLVPKPLQMEADRIMNTSKFATLFLELADKNGGVVGKRMLGDLRRECEVNETPIQLAKAGWIEPIVTEGHIKAGTYRPTDHMREYIKALSPTEPEPTDPLAKAVRLIAQKPAVEEEILNCQLRMEELQRRLKQIDDAIGLVTQLKAIVE